MSAVTIISKKISSEFYPRMIFNIVNKSSLAFVSFHEELQHSIVNWHTCMEFLDVFDEQRWKRLLLLPHFHTYVYLGTAHVNLSMLCNKFNKRFLDEHEVITKIRSLAEKNKIWRSFIGMGYYNCVVPHPIMRNVFENPGW